ncbi:hypothetical protein ER308_12165 [Egibacter rhizosphaerae]|uniref:Uncharacterized protein n=1 Tax=Egibacter rhizosphaerae TaxID=1670831 RepID=A0A411YGA4_9ACTN|nr:DsrE family protein [Egibacter rhizosphaerae]QBI20243.1 hypothetical protein ER308_12165 [Egibacter rhizosphaerae]
MARQVVAILRRGPAAWCVRDPALDATAYALAVDVDLVLVLRGDAVEHAVAGPSGRETSVLASSAADLRGLVESGVRVQAIAEDAAARGLGVAALVDGVELLEVDRLAGCLAEADAVLNW